MKHVFEILIGLLLITIVAYVGISIPRILLANDGIMSNTITEFTDT